MSLSIDRVVAEKARNGDGTRAFARPPLGALGALAVVALYFIAALFAPWIAPFGEAEIVGGPFEPWGGGFLLGTDNLGRDMASRLIFGARNTIGIAAATTALAFLAGGSLGLLAAAAGGLVDQALARFVDVVMAVPQLVLALLLLAVFGTSVPVLILVIALLDATRVFRLARALGRDVALLDFVEAARLRGERLPWIVLREILPNVATTLLAEMGLRFCFVFLFVASLSFLGLGLQPPTADWGSMVRDNATLITYGDWTPLLPAAAIATLTVALNVVVDWLLHVETGDAD